MCLRFQCVITCYSTDWSNCECVFSDHSLYHQGNLLLSYLHLGVPAAERAVSFSPRKHHCPPQRLWEVCHTRFTRVNTFPNPKRRKSTANVILTYTPYIKTSKRGSHIHTELKITQHVLHRKRVALALYRSPEKYLKNVSHTSKKVTLEHF